MDETVDNYCERLTEGLWAEPLNAVTNLAFIIAAMLAWRLARQHRLLKGGPLLLVVLMFSIGIGSGLFHTFATRATQWMDIVPIALFQALFLWLYLRRIISLHIAAASGLMLIFISAGMLTENTTHLLNGSLGYGPALVFVAGMGLWHRLHGAREPNALLYAAALFLVSLLFRTFDNALCAQWPIGTHFMWHLCNAGVLYLSMRGLLANYPRVI